jgi:Fe(3+) dicitrate transport protein
MEPGTDANLIIKAEAIAAHILYNLTVDKLLSHPAFVTKHAKFTELWN